MRLKGRRKKRADPFFKGQKVSSFTECTGLMPALPENEAQDEAYASLYAIHDEPPKGETE